MRDYITVIDIGTTKIVTIVAQYTFNNKIKILGYGIENAKGIKYGDIQNVIEAQESIKRSVEAAKLSSGKNFSEVYIGISGRHIKSHLINHSIELNYENITKEIKNALLEEVKNTVLNESKGESVLHIIPLSYYVDDKIDIPDPIGHYGNKIGGNFLVISASNNAVKVIENILANLNLRVIKPIFEPYAAAEAVLTSTEKMSGIALVDLGGGTSDLIVFLNKKIALTQVLLLDVLLVNKCKLLLKIYLRLLRLVS